MNRSRVPPSAPERRLRRDGLEVAHSDFRSKMGRRPPREGTAARFGRLAPMGFHVLALTWSRFTELSKNERRLLVVARG